YREFLIGTTIKLIQRRAYGFKNFENYRLCVIVLCGHLDEARL
ncbi:MAG TPA: hypothetical protein DD400_05730, partial [Rhodospirillaceae bacterium]|nr:hypothetical protein [Rhodospirillaceae bacterium]